MIEEPCANCAFGKFQWIFFNGLKVAIEIGTCHPTNQRQSFRVNKRECTVSIKVLFYFTMQPPSTSEASSQVFISEIIMFILLIDDVTCYLFLFVIGKHRKVTWQT